MCGRFALAASPDSIAAQFELPLDLPLFRHYAPRYNIAPTQPVAAVRISTAGEREIVPLKWGLIPHWAKDPSIGNRMINARGETVSEKPSFRNSFKRRRCIIPASGFYEWKQAPDNSKMKTPYFIHAEDGALFGFAGLWEHWMSKDDGSELESCAIITTAANAFMAPVHDRMPVILHPKDYADWLNPRLETEPRRLHALIAQYPGERMAKHAVDRLVNSPKNDSPACVQAV